MMHPSSPEVRRTRACGTGASPVAVEGRLLWVPSYGGSVVYGNACASVNVSRGAKADALDSTPGHVYTSGSGNDHANRTHRSDDAERTQHTPDAVRDQCRRPRPSLAAVPV